MKYPKVGVVILTYNSKEYIIPCIQSLQKNIFPNYTVLIVDNNSSDNTVSLIKGNFPDIPVLESEGNLGYAGGNNIGIRYFFKKKYDYVLLLNPDTVVNSELINKLVKVFTNKKIAVSGAIITYMNDKQKIWFAGGYFNRFFCYTKHPYMNKDLISLKLTSGNVDFITGACMMIRSNIFKKIGLLPEQYFLYFEDAFFCRKVISAGYLCYLLAEPLAQHKVSTSTGTAGSNILSPVRAYYYARNPLLYIKNEVSGLRKCTNYIGQLFIRFPFYTIHLLKERQFRLIFYYIKGFCAGIINKKTLL